MKQMTICQEHGVGNCTPCNTSFENKLKSILDDAKKEYFCKSYQDKATYEETLGLLVSKFCEWDGNKIFKVSTEAFEDSNFHTFNEKFNDLWEKEVA